MKLSNYLILLIISGLLLSCGSESEEKITANAVRNPISADGIDRNVKMPMAEIVSKNGGNGKTFDFGIIIQGENVVHTFELKNTGGANLIISSANAACGCTVPSFSKEPIPPGKTGKVDVAFSSAGRTGKQIKSVTLNTNAQPSTITLTIVANIVVPN